MRLGARDTFGGRTGRLDGVHGDEHQVDPYTVAEVCDPGEGGDAVGGVEEVDDLIEQREQQRDPL